MPALIKKPKLVNRGPAGLLAKAPARNGQPELTYKWSGKKNQIAEGLRGMVVPIAALTPDPDNARLHPEKNLESIKQSLDQHGQLKPLVVRKEGMIVVAGNGTLEAAKLLGWTKIAANVVDMDAAKAVSYGLADNRTAELARWDFEVVARLEKIVREQEECGMIGWSADELAAMHGETVQKWQDVWDGMPEFVTEDQTAEVQVIVNLKTRDDLMPLLNLLGYPGGKGWTRATSVRQRPSVWWPPVALMKAGKCKTTN